MEVKVCGFVLPAEIAAVIVDERWTAYTEDNRLPPNTVEAVFGEAPDATWKFYDLDEMRTITEEWHQEDDAGWFGKPPDDIEAKRSVLIGELGYDRPFALDFRDQNPTVRFLSLDGHWRKIADSANLLLDALAITKPTNTE